MSFIINVNTLAAMADELRNLVTKFNSDQLAKLAELDSDSLTAVAQDLAKGSYYGKRHILIDLRTNMKGDDPVSYTGAVIELTNATQIPISFTNTIVGTKDSTTNLVETAAYTSIYTALSAGIKAHNDAATDATTQVHNTELDVVNETLVQYSAVQLRDTDAQSSNIKNISLTVDPLTAQAAKNALPKYSWADSTSALELLIMNFPRFIYDSQVWMKLKETQPLPNSAPGVLINSGSGDLKWQQGTFIRSLGNIDITQGFIANGVDAADVTLGSFGTVTTEGNAHTDWGIGEYVNLGAMLAVDPAGNFIVIDDSHNARALLDTATHTTPKLGELGFDRVSQRLAIALPTSVPGQFSWVDASPAMSVGDMSAVMAADGDILAGIVTNKATTPKQIKDYTDSVHAPMTTDINQLKTDLATAQAALTTATADIVTLQANLATANGQITALTASVANKMDTTAANAAFAPIGHTHP